MIVDDPCDDVSRGAHNKLNAEWCAHRMKEFAEDEVLLMRQQPFLNAGFAREVADVWVQGDWVGDA